MNKEAREQYMQTLRERYLKANKKEKTSILNEYCRNTGQDRKYSIKKFLYKVTLKNPEDRKKKKEIYDNSVKPALAKIWEIFDYPCGQRLKPLIKDELEKLRGFGEISCSDAVAEKLKGIGTATIDRKLKHHKRNGVNCWTRPNIIGVRHMSDTCLTPAVLTPAVLIPLFLNIRLFVSCNAL